MDDLNISETINSLDQLLKEIDDKKQKEKTNKISNIKNSIITIIAILLIIIAFLYLIYLIEKYLLFFPIKTLIKIILNIFLSSYNINRDKYTFIISLFISIFIHFKFIQILILSFIFIAGGLFSRFQLYSQFSCIISEQIIASLRCSLIFTQKEDLIINYNKILLFYNAYTNQKKKNNNESFELKKYQFGENLKEIVQIFERYKESDYQNKEIKRNLCDNMSKYGKNIIPYNEFNFFDILFKFEHHKTITFLKELLFLSFENREIQTISITNNFNAYLISPEKKNKELKTLLIYCGQNAFNIEMISRNRDNLELYLKIKELTILIWNYPGYGARKGFPSFSAIDKDIKELKNYILKYYSDYKIIIHGISIGGYPAIKLCKILNELNDDICLIADRTFSDIDVIAESLSKKLGKSLKFIYNMLFPKFFYHSNNLKNYIDINIENKFIFFDEKDSIINSQISSLFANITKKYYEEIIIPKISKYKEYTKLNNMSKENFQNIKINMRRIINSVSDINFTNFVKSMNKNDIHSFLQYFFVFGYPINIYKEIFYDEKIFGNKFNEIPIILKNIYENNKIIFNTSLFDFFSDLNFLFIKCNLETSFDNKQIKNFKYNNDKKNEFITQENINKNMKKYFGYVHRLFCGHNGTLENDDELYILNFLKLKGFISNENQY